MLKGHSNPIDERALDFAVRIARLCPKIRRQLDWDISRQLMRSGTSIGANIHEAGAAYSKTDFRHKMSIASKEARETRYWLRLVEKLEFQDPELFPLIQESEELTRILTANVMKSTPPR